jgi:hypothetical protein
VPNPFPALILLATCFLSSCANVASKKMLGDAPTHLDADDWNGTWIMPEKMVLHAMVKDPEKGLLSVAFIEADAEKKGFKLKSHEVQIRTSGDWLWGHVKDPETGAWLVCRLKIDEHQLVCWMPNRVTCESLVTSGKLQGEIAMRKNVAPGTLVLDLSRENVHAITEDTMPGFLAMEHPFVLTRLSTE